MPDSLPTPEAVRQALEELRAWRGIARSPQLADLLTYVVEKSLSGDAAGIKAYSIAVDVFGRPQNFDPQADPIVRVQARRLRLLLAQFYAEHPQTELRIGLPVGRYVPEFQYVSPQPASAPPAPPEPMEASRPELGPLEPGPLVEPEPAEVRPRRQDRSWRFDAPGGWVPLLLAACFTVIGVGITVVIQRLVPPAPLLTQDRDLPTMPRVAVGAFANLTGDATLDDAVAQLGLEVVTNLSRFDDVVVVLDSKSGRPALAAEPPENGYWVTGVVRKDAGGYAISALLSRNGNGGILWNTTVSQAASDASYGDMVESAAQTIATQLANGRGPLHEVGRAWLGRQDQLPLRPNLYTCQLQLFDARETEADRETSEAERCFTDVLAGDGQNAVALAARAELEANRIEAQAKPGEPLVARLYTQVDAVQLASQLAPTSSFVKASQARVMELEGNIDRAKTAYFAALALNPANADARAALGRMLVLNGDSTAGGEAAEEALSAMPSPPPWYYETRALQALRGKLYFDAVDAGLILATADARYGPVIVAAAAPFSARFDLAERFRPAILADVSFQEFGIMPVLRGHIHDDVLRERIATGLTLAGLPPNTLTGPFNPDGTPKT